MFAYGRDCLGGEAFEHSWVVTDQDEDAHAVVEGQLGECFSGQLVRQDIEQPGDLAGIPVCDLGRGVDNRVSLWHACGSDDRQ